MSGRNMTKLFSPSLYYHCVAKHDCLQYDAHYTCIDNYCYCTSDFMWDGSKCVLEHKAKDNGCPNRLVSCISVSSLVGILILAIIGIFVYKIYRLRKTLRNHENWDFLANGQTLPTTRTVNTSPINTIRIENKPPPYSSIICSKEQDMDFNQLPTYEEAMDKINRTSVISNSSQYTQTSTISEENDWSSVVRDENGELSNDILTQNENDLSPCNSMIIHQTAIESLPCFVKISVNQENSSTSVNESHSSDTSLPSSSTS